MRVAEVPKVCLQAFENAGGVGGIRYHHRPRRLCMSAYVSIRQHTSAYVSIRQHASAYVMPAALDAFTITTVHGASVYTAYEALSD